MKILNKIFFAIMFLFVCVVAPAPFKQNASAASIRRSIDLEFEQVDEKDKDRFSFRVKINNNEGINSLKFELSYDAEAMMLTYFDKGSTLSKLNLETPEDDKPEGYAYTPFTFEYSASDNSVNDNSNGVILLLKFKLREGAENKNYRVTFINCEAKYYDDESLSHEKCDVSSDEMRVKVEDGKVVGTKIADRVDDNGVALWVVLVSIIGGLAIILAGTALCVYLFKHKNIFQRKREQRKIKKIIAAGKKDEPIDYKSLNRSTKSKKKTKNRRIKKK